MANEFWEAYKHPKWQLKRLEVIKRAGGKCQHCRAEDKTLHVHHGYYERDKKPWEYPECSLWCLCNDCHESAQAAKLHFHANFASLRKHEIQEITGYLTGILMRHDREITVEITNQDFLEGLWKSWGYHENDCPYVGDGENGTAIVSGHQMSMIQYESDPKTALSR